MSARAVRRAAAPRESVGGDGARAASRALLGVGVAAWVLALAALVRQLVAPIGSYDEGHLLTDAMLVGRGLFPYADFYTNYPPAIFWLVAGAWKLSGESLLVARLVGVATHLVAAFVAGRLVARLVVAHFADAPRDAATGSPRPGAPSLDRGSGHVAIFASGVLFLWWRHQPIWPTAFAVGITCLLVAWDRYLVAVASRRARDWAAVGLAIGLVGAFRHDLFVYATLATLGVLALERVRERFLAAPAPSVRPRGREWGWLALSIAVPLAVTWGIVLAKAGVDAPLHDLILDQKRYMVSGRSLPFPSFDRIKATQVALVLVLAGPALAVSLWIRRGGRAVASPLVVLSVCVLPQMASRTDAQHVQFALTPALIAATAWIAVGALAPGASKARRVLASVLGAGLLLGSLGGLQVRWDRTWVRASLPRLGPAYESNATRAAGRERVLRFVEERVPPGAPIWVGGTQHALVNVNQMELYFLTGRGGATHYLQFEPNITNRDDVQAQMIADFEARGLAVAILSDDYRAEPNDSSKRGSDRLDAYFRECYQVAERAGGYQMLVRAR